MSSSVHHVATSMQRKLRNLEMEIRRSSLPLRKAESMLLATLNDEQVDRRVNVNLQNDDGDSPLSVACRFGHAAIVAALLKSEVVEINATDRDGKSALYTTCEVGNSAVLDLLLATRNNVQEGMIPLHVACIANGRSEDDQKYFVGELLEAGADREARDHQGRNIFNVIEEYGKDFLLPLFSN